MRGASTYPLADHTETTALGATATTPLESNCEWVAHLGQYLHHQKENALTMSEMMMPTVLFNLSEMMMPTVLFNLLGMTMPTVLLTFPNMCQRLPDILRQKCQRLPDILRQPQRLPRIIAKTETVLMSTVLLSFPELLQLFLGLSIPCTPGLQNA